MSLSLSLCLFDSLWLSVSMSLYLSVSMSFFGDSLFVPASVYNYVTSSVSLCLSPLPLFKSPLYLSVSVCSFSVCSTLVFPSVSPSFYLSDSVCRSLYLSLRMSICFCLSFCLSHYPCLRVSVFLSVSNSLC